MVLKKRLGEILLESKLLTDEQLEQALTESKKVGLKLGLYITRQGILNENQIIDVLSRQLKINKYCPDTYPLDMNLASLFPIEMAKEFQVAPLRKNGRLLTIAITDPQNINALDTIEATTNSEVDPIICTEKEIFQLINDLYGIRSETNINLDAEMKKCPFCQEEIQDAAIKCRYCGEWLSNKSNNVIDSDSSALQHNKTFKDDSVSTSNLTEMVNSDERAESIRYISEEEQSIKEMSNERQVNQKNNLESDRKAKLLYNEGCYEHDKGNYAKAIEKYSEAIFINPLYGKAYNNRGIAFKKLGKKVEANNDLEKAKLLEIDTIPVYYVKPESLKKMWRLSFILLGFGCLFGLSNDNGAKLLSILLVIIGLVLTCILHYRFWDIIQDGNPRTTPGKAVGYSFIPVFWFYWWYEAYVGLAKDMNVYCRERKIAVKIDERLALAYFILLLAASLTVSIPQIILPISIGAWIVYIIITKEFTEATIAIIKYKQKCK